MELVPPRQQCIWEWFCFVFISLYCLRRMQPHVAAGLEAVHHVSVSMGVIPKHRNIWIRSGGVLLIFSSGYWEVLFAIHLGREPKGRWDTPAGILGQLGRRAQGTEISTESHGAGMLLQPGGVMALTCGWVQVPAWIPGTFLHPGTLVCWK